MGDGWGAGAAGTDAGVVSGTNVGDGIGVGNAAEVGSAVGGKAVGGATVAGTTVGALVTDGAGVGCDVGAWASGGLNLSRSSQPNATPTTSVRIIRGRLVFLGMG